MRYRILSDSQLRASAICLGTGGFGSRYSPDRSWEMLDAFAEVGGNFVDTAHVYGEGASERTLGSWLARSGMRREFIIGTKGGHPHLETMNIPRLSPSEITHDLFESLDRLQTDYVDLYWLHRDDSARPVEEILAVLNGHLSAGRIRAIGASNWTPERLKEAAACAKARGIAGFCASQIGWSLAQCNTDAMELFGSMYMNQRIMAYHRETGMPLVAYSSQAKGFFSGDYRRNHQLPERPSAGNVSLLYYSEENFARLRRARLLGQEYRRSANDIALAYLLSQPFAVYPIVGCRTVEQVIASCGGSETRLSGEDISFLEGQ